MNMILALVNYFKLPVMNEKGQGMVEYALIVAIISLAAITIMPTVGSDILAVFTSISTALTPAS